MTTRHDIVREALSWLGTKWHHQATVKGVGCDCRGLIVGVAVALDIPGGREALCDPKLRGYGREPNDSTLLDACPQYLDPIAIDKARPGDVLVLFNVSRLRPQHFAILTRMAPNYIVHAWAQRRSVVENILDDTWQQRIVGAFSYRGLE